MAVLKLSSCSGINTVSTLHTKKTTGVKILGKKAGQLRHNPGKFSLIKPGLVFLWEKVNSLPVHASHQQQVS